MATIYWCEECNKVVEPYRGDPGEPTCMECGDSIDGMDTKIILKMAKYLEKKNAKERRTITRVKTTT